MKRQIIIVFTLLCLSACAMFRHHTQQAGPQTSNKTVPSGIPFYMPSLHDEKPGKPVKPRNIDSLLSPYYKLNFDRFFKAKFDSINRLLKTMPIIINQQRLHADSINAANIVLTKLNYNSALQQAVLTKIAVDAVASKQDAMAAKLKSVNEVDLLLKRLYSMEIMPYMIIAAFILLFIVATPDLLKAVFAYFKRKHLEGEIKKLHNAK